MSPELQLSAAARKGFGGVPAIFATSVVVIAACVLDFFYFNPFRSLYASIPTVVYVVAAVVSGLVGWLWANRVSRSGRLAPVLAGVAVSLAALAIVVAWVPRLDQWTSERVAVAYQFTDRGVYRRVQPPHDERHPRYFLLREQDVKVYDQFLVLVIDGKLGTYVNFNTLIPLGRR